MADEDAACLPCAHIPQAHAVVAGTGGQEVGVGVPPGHLHIRVMPYTDKNGFLELYFGVTLLSGTPTFRCSRKAASS